MMNSTQSLTDRTSRFVALLSQLMLVCLIATVVVLLSGMLFVLSTRVVYTGRALPGVSAAGASLSGLTKTQIETQLHTTLTYPDTGLVVLRDGETVWTAKPAQLGVLIDVPGMSAEALSVGRRGGLFERLREQLDAWYLGHNIPTKVIFDHVVGAVYLEGLAGELNRELREASITVEGTEISMQHGQIGRELQIQAVLQELQGPIARMHDVDLTLKIEETSPVVLDATPAVESAREILSAPLTLTAEGEDSWTLEPDELAPMLTFILEESDAGAGYNVELDPELFRSFLEPLAPVLKRTPQNARFIFNDDTRQLDLLEQAVIGRSLDMDQTLESVNHGLNSGQHQVPVAFQLEQPLAGDDATVQELGISEAVSVVSTYFYGSSPERVQNIKTASGAFHGLLVAPGETLSMAEVLGDISLDNGYAEALIIFGDRTIKGVGGGVCQVSTTLFRAAFFGGYPIVERHPHAYRVGYYELTRYGGRDESLAGLDATVFVPVVDFKFTNDTGSWLLLETYVYKDNQLQWKFYSTSDGRSVEWSSNQSNKVEAPDPLYKENKDLAKGKIKQIDYEADGLDVVVYRTVRRESETLYKDTFKTHYLPWRAIYEYGPGTKLPRDAKTE
jgi:vancomycin resistance protein YoaR